MRIEMPAIFLNLDDTAEYTSLSGTSIQKLVHAGKFPKPRLLANRRVGWLVREIDEWAESRPVSDLSPPPNTGHVNRRRRRSEP